MARLQATTKNTSGFTVIEVSIATAVFAVIILASVTAITMLGKNYTKGITITKTQQAVRQALEAMSQQLQFTTSEFNSSQAGGSPASLCHLFEFQRKLGKNQNTNCSDERYKDICLGQDLFEIVKVPDSESLSDIDNTLQRTPYATACRDANDTTKQLDPVRLLPANVKLESLRIDYIEPQPGPSGNINANTRRDIERELWTITIRVSFGDDDLFTSDALSDGYAQGSDNIWRRACRAPTRIGGQFCGVTELTTSVERRL